MSLDQSPRLPAPKGFKPFKPTLYPHRVFIAPPPRPPASRDDRLLAHVAAAVAPAPQPERRPRLRPKAVAPRPVRAAPKLSLRETTRRWNDVLGIWRSCAQKDCRRKGRCDGEPLHCLPRHLPSVPPLTRLWFACVGVAAQQRLSFGEALTLAEREGEAALCARWHRALERALPPPAQPDTTREAR
jgi:hypothetical protein